MKKVLAVTILTLVVLSPLVVSAQGIKNPIKAESVQEFLFSLIKVAIIFAAPLLALMIVIAGFMYATGGGSKEKIEKAGKMIKYGIIGFLIIVLAWALVAVLQNIFVVPSQARQCWLLCSYQINQKVDCGSLTCTNPPDGCNCVPI